MEINNDIKENFAITEKGVIIGLSNTIEIGIAIQLIAQTIDCNANAGVLMPYKTRKFFYKLCKKLGVPHHKLYVDSLLLNNAFTFFEKAELGKKYLRQWWWAPLVITMPIMIIRMRKLARKIRDMNDKEPMANRKIAR